MTHYEFYTMCASILDIEIEDHSFSHYKRTRWNNRSPGNGRFPGFGLIRIYGDMIHITTKNNNMTFASKSEALTWLSGGTETAESS